ITPNGGTRMRSIRLSLTVYFLALLAVALGAVSVLVYGNTRQTLEGKERAAEQLVEARYKDDCQREQQTLDDKLLQQARTVAQLVQLQRDWSKQHELHKKLQDWPAALRGGWREAPPVPAHQVAGLLGSFSLPHPAGAAPLAFWGDSNKRNFPGF